MGKIRVVKDPPPQKCNCSSWLEHWKNASQQPVSLCIEWTCMKKDVIGVCVQKEGSADTGIYVLPLCITHSNSKLVLDIQDAYKMITVEPTEYCAGKK
jgi:hypothetical protein